MCGFCLRYISINGENFVRVKLNIILMGIKNLINLASVSSYAEFDLLKYFLILNT